MEKVEFLPVWRYSRFNAYNSNSFVGSYSTNFKYYAVNTDVKPERQKELDSVLILAFLTAA